MRVRKHIIKMADFFQEILFAESSDEEFEGFSSDEEKINHETDRVTEIDDNFMRNWIAGDRPKVNMPFTGKPGLDPTIRLPEVPTPLDFFSLFLTDDDFLTMANETNRYAKQYLEKKIL